MSNAFSVHFIGILSIVLSLVQPLSDGSSTIDNDSARGDLTVTIVGSDGAALGGACFAVSDSNGGSTGGCTGGGGSGTVYGLPAGSVSVRQTSGPEGYQLAGSRSANVPENGTGSVTLTAAAIPVVVPDEPKQTEDTKTDIINDTRTDIDNNAKTDTTTDTKTDISVKPDDSGTTTDTSTDSASSQQPTPTPPVNVAALTTELESMAGKSDIGVLSAGDMTLTCNHTPGEVTTDFTVKVEDIVGTANPFSYTVTAWDLYGNVAFTDTLSTEDEVVYDDREWRRIAVSANFSEGTSGSASAGCNSEVLQPAVSTLAQTDTGTPIHDGDRIEVGTAFHDTATLSNQSVDAAGTVTYYLYESGTSCEPGTHIQSSGPHAVVDGVVPDSGSFNVAESGSYDLVAVYTGDVEQGDAQHNSHFNSPATSACGDETVIVGQVSPSITTAMQTDAGGDMPHLGTVPFGTDVRDTALLSGATEDAGGTVTYTLYEGESCPGTAVEGASFEVNVTNGNVPASEVVNDLPQGTYHWVVEYSGDEKNTSAISECGEETFSVGKATPTVTTAMHAADGTSINDGSSVPVGTVSYDTAVISGGSEPYTGTVAYTLHYSATGSDTCNTENIEYTSGELDIVDGVIPPSGNVPLDKVGTWNWVVTYSGDAGNESAVSTCGTETVNVEPVSPSITTEIYNVDGVVAPGTVLPAESAQSSVHDTATLGGVVDGVTPTGSVTYYLYNSYLCDTPFETYGPSPLNPDGTLPDSPDTGQLGSGTWNWVVEYSGDDNYNGVSSGCGDEQFFVGQGRGGITTLVTGTDGTEYPDGSKVTVDSVLHDTAVLHGVTPDAGGNVNFFLYEGESCEGTRIPVGSATVVNGELQGTSADYTFDTKDTTYQWVAEYTGDTNNASVSSECGAETIEIIGRSSSVTTTMYTQAGAEIPDDAKVLAGTTVYDTAVVTGEENGPAVTGTLTYTLYSDANCNTQVGLSTTVPVGQQSQSYTLTTPSIYNWHVEYSGDENYAGSASGCGEETFFLALKPTITTMMVDENGDEITSGSTITAGDQIGDTAILNGATDDASGTVTYNFYLGDSCDGDLVYAPTVNVTNGVVEDSPIVTPPFLGDWSIQAVYSGDQLNYDATSDCGTENFTVDLNSTPSVSTTMKADGTDVAHNGQVQYLTAGNEIDVTDTLNIFGVLPGSTGDITFELYKGTSCSGIPVFTDTQPNVVVENRSLSFESGAHTLTVDDWGTYNWRVTWNGDVNGDETSDTLISECGDETFVAVSQYPYTAGITCTYHGADDTTSYTVNANKRTSLDPDQDPNLSVIVTPTDNLLNPLSPIEYHTYDSDLAPNPPVDFSRQDWRQISVLITWPDGQTWDGSASCNENPLTPDLTTEMMKVGEPDTPISDGGSVSLGDTVFDTATITGGTVTRTGTLTYTLYRSESCEAGTDVFGPDTYTLSGSEIPSSATYTPDQPGTYNWVVSYSGDKNNESADSKCGDETFTVAGPDIAVTKTAVDDEVNAGENASFTITVDNVGEGRADNVTLNDILPPGVAWSIASQVDGCAINGDDELNCGLGSMEPDDDPVTITVTGTTDATDCGSLDNLSALGGASNEPRDEATLANNEDSASIEVICADVTVEKAPTTAEGAVISAGDTASFTITVSNIGPVDATNVSVSDELPGGVTWGLTSAVSGCEITGTAPQTLNCSFAVLGANSSQDIIVSGETDAADCDTITNVVAEVSASNEGDGATDNNTSDPASITVECPDVTVEKSTTTPEVSAGDEVSFTITVDNVGDGRADNVMLNDTLPSGVAWAITPPVDGCVINGGNQLSCDFGSLAFDDDPIVITVTGTTDATDCDSITNEVASVVASNEQESAGGNNTSGPVLIEVDCPDIEVTKAPTTEAGAVISAGDIASFTITINNLGDGRADDIEVTDVLPDGIDWSIISAVSGCSIDDTDNRTLTCSIESLAAHSSIAITVVGTTDASDCGPLFNPSASATASNEPQDEETLENNKDSSSITVQCPDLTVVKSPTTDEDAVISASDTASFTFTVTNIGNGRANNVTVVDFLPPNVDWAILSPVEGCEIAGTPAKVSCSIASLDAGASFSVTVTGVPDAEDCGRLTNIVTVGAGNEASTQLENNGDSATINVLCPEMSITKVPADDVVSSGDDVSYTITVINNGDGNAYNVDVTDVLPAGVTWSMNPAVDGCEIAVVDGIQTLSCDFGTMATLTQHQIVVTGTTEPGFCGDLRNIAYVTSTNESESEDVQENNSGYAEIEVDCPDIEVTKAPTTEAGAVISAGDTASFTITVDNVGDGRADGVILTDTLPSGVEWSVNPAVEGCAISEAGVLTCNIGTIAFDDDPIIITVTGTTDAADCGTLDNTVSATSTNEGDDKLGNNSDGALIEVDCPDVEVTKTTDTPEVSAGDEVSFTITVDNVGDGRADNVMLNDTLPAGVDWEINPQVDGCVINGDNELSCGFGSLAFDDDPIIITVTGTTDATDCDSITNEVASVVASNEQESAGGNNTSGPVLIEVDCPDVEVTKTTTTPAISAGDTASFTITVANNGDGRADNVILTDTLPAGVVWTIDPAVEDCAIAEDGVTLTCSVESMASGTSFSIVVTGETDAADCGSLSNPFARATVGNEGEDTLEDNTSDSASIEVDCPDIEVTKAPTTEAGATISAGDTASFTITVDNVGDGRADNVMLNDTLPAGVAWSITPPVDGCVINGGNQLSCNFGTIAFDDDPIVITVTGTTDATDCGTLDNPSASATASNEGEDTLANNADSASIEVDCPDIEVTKTTDTPEVSAGDEVSFTITVDNVGDGRADNVMLNDTLPAGVDWTINPQVDGCVINGDNELSCGFGSLAFDDDPIIITVTGTTDATDCGTLDNPSASVSATNELQDEETLDNNQASAEIEVDCPDVEVTKATDTPEVSAGDAVSFTITVSNIGDGRADGVTLTDALPAGVDWTIDPAVDPDIANCSVIGTTTQVLSCDIGTMASGSAFSVTVTGVTDAADCGTLDNRSASASAANELRDEDTLDNNSDEASIEVGCPDIVVEKTTTTPVVSATDPVSFTITVRNIGDGRADSVKLADSLPAAVAWTINPEVEGCAISDDGTLTCDIGTMAADGEPFTVTVTGVTDAADCGLLVNRSASASAANESVSDEDEVLANNSDDAEIQVLCPEMSVTKVATDDVVSSGDRVSYTITAINNGEGNAYNVDVTDELPAGIDWSMNPAVEGCAITVTDGIQTLECEFGTMAFGAQQVITVTGLTEPGVCGNLQNRAYVTSTNESTSEEVQQNNSGLAEIDVDCPDVEVTKTTTTPVISAGDTASFTITVDNIGAGRADDVRLTDNLPSGVAWTIASPVEGCAISEAGVLTCNIGTMAADGEPFSVTVTGVTDAADCGSLDNVASALGSNESRDTRENNSDEASIEVDCPDVEVTKTTDTPEVSAGDAVSFTITVDNVGDGRADNVMLNDTLPSGVAWAITPPVAGCAIADDGVTLSCDFGSFASDDDPITITVTGVTDAADCGTLDNPSAGAIASNEGEDTLANNEDSASIEVDCPDVEVTKTTTTPTVSAGDEVSFIITVDNVGDGRADGVTLTDALPAGVVWAIDPAVDGCAISDAGVLTCAIGTMAADGEPFTVTVTGTTDAADCGTLDNPSARAEVANEGDDTLANNEASAEIDVDCPDIEVTKTTTTPTVSAGDEVSFTITVDNVGDGRADNVMLNDTLPPSVAWAIDPEVEGCAIAEDGVTLTCDFGTLAADGEPFTVIVTGTTDAADCGSLDNLSAIGSARNEGEDTLANNEASASIEVDCPDIEVTKTTTTPVVSAGDGVSFTITVDNVGDGRADNVILTDTLPAGVAWTIDPAVEGCEISDDGILTCTIGTMAADGEPFSVTVSGLTAAENCGILANTTSATAGNESVSDEDEVLVNNTDTTEIQVLCPEMSVTKTAGDATVSSGDEVSYTITAINNGEGNAYNVDVTDTLPAGVVWSIEPAVEGCAITDVDGRQELTCDFGTMASGAEHLVTVTGTTEPGFCGNLQNRAYVTSTNESTSEEVQQNNSGLAEIDVDCPDIEVEKTTTTPVVSAGDDVSFTISVANDGEGRADGVTLTDTLPTGVAWTIDPAVEGCEINDDGVLTCTIGTMAPGSEPFTVTVTATTDGASCGTLNNVAEASATNETETLLDNNSDEASIQIDCPDIEVEKTTDTPVVSAGDDVSFTVTATNVGDGVASDVELTDELPAGVAWTIDPAVEGCEISDEGVLTCAIGAMAPEDAFSVTVTGMAETVDCGTLDNTASATASNEGDEALDNNSDSVSIAVNCPDIEVEKTTETPVVSAGDDVSFTVTATNVGDGTANVVVLTDDLPAGIAWSIDPAVEGCAISDDGVLTCFVGALESGEAIAVTVVGESTPADCGTLANTASATSTNEAAAARGNNEASASIVVNCPDIEVEKTADAASVSASDRVSFTITATNIGEGRADEVVLTDALPAGFNWTVTGDVTATCEVVDGNLICSIGTLEAGASAAIVVSAPATMSQCGTVQNAVSVEAGNEPGSVLDNNVAEAEAEIACPPAPTPTPGLDPDTREPVTMLPVTGTGDQAGTSSMAAFWALVIAAMLAMAGMATLTVSGQRKRSH